MNDPFFRVQMKIGSVLKNTLKMIFYSHQSHVKLLLRPQKSHLMAWRSIIALASCSHFPLHYLASGSKFLYPSHREDFFFLCFSLNFSTLAPWSHSRFFLSLIHVWNKKKHREKEEAEEEAAGKEDKEEIAD